MTKIKWMQKRRNQIHVAQLDEQTILTKMINLMLIEPSLMKIWNKFQPRQEIMKIMKMNRQLIPQRVEEVPEKGKKFLLTKEMMKQVKLQIVYRQKMKLTSLSIATYVRRVLLTTITLGHIKSNAGLLERNTSAPHVEKDLT